ALWLSVEPLPSGESGFGQQRASRVAFYSNYHVWTEPSQDPKRGNKAGRKPQKRLDSFKDRDAFQGAYFHQLEIETLAGNNLRFEPARSPDKEDLRFAFAPPELVRDGDTRIDVPTRSAGSDNHPHINSELRSAD